MTEIILRSQTLKWRKQWKDRQRRWNRKWEAQQDRLLDQVILKLKNQIDFCHWTWDDRNSPKLALIMETVMTKFCGKNGMSINRLTYLVGLTITAGTMYEMKQRGQLESKHDSYGRRTFRLPNGRH